MQDIFALVQQPACNGLLTILHYIQIVNRQKSIFILEQIPFQILEDPFNVNGE